MTYTLTQTLRALTVWRGHEKDGKESLISARELYIEFEFCSETLGEHGRVMPVLDSANALMNLSDYLRRTVFVAEDDPHLDLICSLASGPADVVVLKKASKACLADHIHYALGVWLFEQEYDSRVRVGSVRVDGTRKNK